MKRYVKEQDFLDIVLPIYTMEGVDKSITMHKVIDLLLRAEGHYEISDGKLIFIEDYDLSNYKWSSSIIGSEEEKIESHQKMIHAMEEERRWINEILVHINREFADYENIFLEVFVDRYFRKKDVRKICFERLISNKRYYSIIDAGEWIFQRGTFIR